MAPLVSPAELDTYMQRSVDADVAALAVAGASGTVRDHCGWVISQETEVTLTARGDGARVLGLPTLYLLGVDEVRVAGEVVDVSGYSWARQGQLYRDTAWPSWVEIEADVTHGFDPTPDAIKIVALALAAQYVTNPDMVRSASVGSVQRTFFNDMPLMERLLDPYRLP